jgi:hypothetical protein
LQSFFRRSQAHVIIFGKPAAAKWMVGPGEDKAIDLKVRGL